MTTAGVIHTILEEKQRSEYTCPLWHNVVAGGVAGAGSRLVTAPLDMIRIRRQLTPRTMYPSENLLQSWQRIVDTEGGIMALFRGNTAAIYLWVGYAAVQFATYDHVKSWVAGGRPPSNIISHHQQHIISSPALPSINIGGQNRSSLFAEPFISFTAGAIAGLLATITTYPFDLCRTVFAARGIEESSSSSCHSTNNHTHITTTSNTSINCSNPPKTIQQFIVQLYRQRGIYGFYAGIGPACIQIVPYMGFNFAIYHTLTQGDKGISLSAYAGSVSGAISKIIIYPLDTIKRRLQSQSFFDPIHLYYRARPYTGMMDCAISIANEEGFVAFYRGVVPSVLKTAIATGISFSLFRFAKNCLETLHKS